jgi:hypothetical protein
MHPILINKWINADYSRSFSLHTLFLNMILRRASYFNQRMAGTHEIIPDNANKN